MRTRIVVTGMGIWSPIGKTIDEVASSLRRSVCGIRENRQVFAESTVWGGLLGNDDAGGGMSANGACEVDRTAQLAIVAAKRALEDATGSTTTMPVDTSRLALIFGTSHGGRSQLDRVVEEGSNGLDEEAARRLIAQEFSDWCDGHERDLLYIEPGKPDQNAFIERFNRTYREEVLNAHAFESVRQAQRISDDWLIDYNEEQPHASRGSVPPSTFMPRNIRDLSRNAWST